MIDSGYRISDLNNIPVTTGDGKLKNKIVLDNTYILSYSHTVYGINYNKQNYKIPLTALRDDIKAYIGVESLVAPWSEQMKLWHGVWHDTTSRNKSYTYKWKPEEFAHEHYSPEKFSDLENSYYIIRDNPFPYETGDLNNRENGEKEAETLDDGTVISVNLPIKAADPYPESNKIVTKKYVDERLASKRIIEVTTEFRVRDYDCTYIIRSEELIKAEAENKPATLKIHFPESYCSRILHNKLAFDILLEGVLEEGIWKPAVEEDVNWEFYLHDGTRINHIFFSNSANKLPRANDESLYSNAQYLIFRVESITDHIDSEEIIENIAGVDIITGHTVTPRAEVYILCENLLYRRRAIEYVNDKTGDILLIESENNSVLIDTSLNGGTITVDLKTDIQSTDDLVVVAPPTEEKKFWGLSIDTDNLPTVVSADESIDVDFKDNAYDLSVNKDKLPKVVEGDNSINVETNEEGNYEISVNKDGLPKAVEGDNTIDIETNADGNYEISVNREVVKTVINGDNTFITATKDNDSDSDVWSLAFNETMLKFRKYVVSFGGGTVYLKDSYNRNYYTTDNDLNLIFDAASVPDGEMMTVDFFYMPTAQSTIVASLHDSNEVHDVKWAMNTESPVFKPNRVYSITFTYISKAAWPTNTPQLFARVNWFRDL